MDKNLTDNNLNDHKLTDKKSTDNKLKLDFELVPDGCWYSNLRSILKPAQWDVVRREAYARANGKCMICGRPTKRLEAHERWSYDEKNAVQKLEDVIAVCVIRAIRLSTSAERNFSATRKRQSRIL
mgnify:CR=1 FL=1